MFESKIEKLICFYFISQSKGLENSVYEHKMSLGWGGARKVPLII